MDASQQNRLREPFPPEHVGKLPKSGTMLDYVGHGAVTDRLLEVDPEWNWEPVATDDQGLPVFVYDEGLHPVALWIRLTIGGVTRLGVGTCGPKQFDAEKVLIGDAIRNAAMRFGVALDLWIRGQAEDAEAFVASDTRESRGRRNSTPAKAAESQVSEFNGLLGRLDDAGKARLKAWFTENECPPIAKASAQQAAGAIAAAREIAGDGGEVPDSPPDGTETATAQAAPLPGTTDTSNGKEAAR